MRFSKIYVKRAILASSLLVAVQMHCPRFHERYAKNRGHSPVFILGNALYKLPELHWCHMVGSPLFVISVVIISSYTFKQI